MMKFTFDLMRRNEVIEECNLISCSMEEVLIQQHLECKIHDLDQVEIHSI